MEEESEESLFLPRGSNKSINHYYHIVYTVEQTSNTRKRQQRNTEATFTCVRGTFSSCTRQKNVAPTISHTAVRKSIKNNLTTTHNREPNGELKIISGMHVAYNPRTGVLLRTLLW